MASPLSLERPPGWVRFTPLWLLPLPAAWVAYVLSFNPTDRIPDPTGPCLWHRLFGIDGPTCGITRMTWYLLHGDLLDAARMHLAAFIAVPVGVYGYLWWAAGDRGEAVQAVVGVGDGTGGVSHGGAVAVAVVVVGHRGGAVGVGQ